MSDELQVPDELQAPPLLTQLISCLVSILASVGSAVGMFFVLSDKYLYINLIVFFVVALIGYYLATSCLSRKFTGSWSKYPNMVPNIPD